MSSNCYLLQDDSPFFWLVDPGDVYPVLPYVAGKMLKGILITHTHYDHIYGINEWCERYPEAVIYVSEKGKEGLYNSRLNLSYYHQADFALKTFCRVIVIGEGSKINGGKDLCIEVMETPGHDWSSVCFKLENNLFTGDSYIPGHKVVTVFPRSNKTDAAESLARIEKIISGKNLYPGHGEEVIFRKKTFCGMIGKLLKYLFIPVYLHKIVQ